MDLLTIVSTEPQSGKTVLAAALGLVARQHGVRPIYRRAGENADADVAFAGSVLGDAGKLTTPAQWLTADADLVLLESDADAGSAAAQSGGVLLVAWYREGMTPRDLRAAVGPFRERLAGLLVNGVPELRSHFVESELLPALRAAGLPVLGVLPQHRLLMAPSLGEIVDFLSAQVLAFPEKLDVLVESVMIGALALDGGAYYFGQRSRKVVITRWDRPDLQMPALATGCQGLILTGGKGPIPYVWNRLQELQVPVAVVQGGTIATAARLNDGFLARRGRPHLAKVEEMASLVGQLPDLLGLVVGARAGR